jgi:hypothetical protein
MSIHQYTKQLSNHGPFIKEILLKLDDLIDTVTAHHENVLFVRANLNFPLSTFPKTPGDSDMPSYPTRTDSAVISRFQDELTRLINAYVNRYSKSHTLSYCLWVRERSKELGYHYHVLIAVNRNTFMNLGDLNSRGNLSHMIQQAWNSAMGIGAEPPYFVHFSNYHYIGKKMSAFEVSTRLTDAYTHFSYMAKVDTKPFGDGRRNYGCSNLNNAGWFLMTQQIKRKGA